MKITILSMMTSLLLFSACSEENEKNTLQNNAEQKQNVEKENSEEMEVKEESLNDTQEADYILEMSNFKYVPNTLEMYEGESIRVKLKNVEGFHDFVIDELGVQAEAIEEGNEIIVEITAPEGSGGSSYSFYCSIGRHRENGMEGIIRILQKEESKKMETEDLSDHIGCQEGEIVDGVCTVAEDGDKNADLFANIDSLPVSGEEVQYMKDVFGYIARPDTDGTYPGVVMIHEWWGLNENVKDMAKLLANEGYVVLAVDLYEGRVAETSEDAGTYAGEVRSDPERGVANMREAVEYLKSLPNVEKEKIASLGWCFGGQQSLNLALKSDDLSATVIYYGNLVTEPEELTNISWPVLGIFGEEDSGIPPETVREFEAALNTNGIINEIYIYPGVGHAFANPSGSRYAPEETRDAWEKTLAFLAQYL